MKNFMAMPILLRLLTGGTLVIVLFVLSTAIPGRTVHVFDRDVVNSEWWSTGAGPFMLIVALLMSASAVMMLTKSRHSRLAYIIGWIALSISIPFVAGVAGVETSETKPALISNLLLTTAIALYLYLSKGAREYFRVAPN